MIQPITMQQQQTEFDNKKIVEIFDPPMCCPTGLCGPFLDQTLLNVNEMILTLQSRGVMVKRYQMASDPNAFLNNKSVIELVRKNQISALPITVVNGNIIKSGGYPSLADVEIALNEGTL
ncbi:MAG: arsenite efflux transporter metallochaperone ArsD [Bacillota bacterium]